MPVFQRDDVDSQYIDFGPNGRDIIISLGVSLVNLCVNYWQFRKAAKFHGYSVVYVVFEIYNGIMALPFCLSHLQIVRVVSDSNGGGSHYEIRAPISCH